VDNPQFDLSAVKILSQSRKAAHLPEGFEISSPIGIFSPYSLLKMGLSA
jgi:hypothetical protein